MRLRVAFTYLLVDQVEISLEDRWKGKCYRIIQGYNERVG